MRRIEFQEKRRIRRREGEEKDQEKRRIRRIGFHGRKEG